MYLIVWKYSVPAAHASAFVRAYGPEGDWVQLFGSAPGYLGTELIACDDSDTYMTIDRWSTKAAFDAFVLARRVDYHNLDERLAELTTEEILVGRGVSVT